MKYPTMFTPLQIGTLTIKNRIVMGAIGHGQAAPECEFSKAAEDFYALRAKGGVGLILTGITEPDFEVDKFQNGGISSYVNPNFNPKVFIEHSSEMTERVHSYGSKIFIQITAGFGRALHDNSCSSENTLWGDPTKQAHGLTKAEIQRKIELVASAAVIAQSAGFDGIDLSALHEGCLMEEFATPFFNKRTDEYGGSFENRMRFTKELVETVKSACGKNFPISIRMAAKSYLKGFNTPSLDGSEEVGRTLEDSIEIARYLEQIGVDLLLVDSGSFDSMYHLYQPMYVEKGSNLRFSEAIKKAVNIPVICTGRMDEPHIIEEGLVKEQADGVSISRGLLADADLVNKALLGQDEKIRPCIGCNVGCLHRVLTGRRYSCAVNPQAMRETTYSLTSALQPKKVLVIGGGVAGMEAARVAKIRGHFPTLWEKSGRLGGHLISGGAPSFKEDERRLIHWYEQELSAMNVPVVMNKTATPADVLEFVPDAVIVATGSQAVIPRSLQGADKAITSTDALLENKPVGQRTVIIGGGLVGCELALHLKEQGKEVTIIEMMPEILSNGKTVPLMNKMMLSDLIENSTISVKTSCKLLSIGNDGVVVDYEGQEQHFIADTVIVAAGFRSENALFHELAGNVEVYNIGDSRSVENIKNAIWDAYEVARLL